MFRRSRLLLGALYGGLAFLFCARLFASPHGVGLGDWDQHLFFYASVLKNVVEYGAAPFWNPWYCGGNVLWANPQVALVSPVYPLALVTSLPLAMTLNILLHYWVGLVGMHLLLRRVIGLASLPVVVYLASVFALSSAHAWHLRVGHSVFLPAFFLPWLFYGLLRAVETGRVRCALGAGAVLALLMYAGGMHVVPMAVVSAAVLVVVAAVAGRSWRPLAAAGVMVVAGAAYAGPKLVPVALFIGGDDFRDARGFLDRVEWMSPGMLLAAYTYRDPDLAPAFEMQHHAWHEYANYMGGLLPVLFVASLGWLMVRRRARDWWLGAGLAAAAVSTLLVSAGEFAPWAPAALARFLPFFSSYRVPSRFTLVVGLFAALTVAWVWRELTAGGLDRRVRAGVTVVCLLATAELVVWNGVWFRDVFSDRPLDQGFEWGGGPGTITVDAETNPYGGGAPMLRALMADRSFYDCYEPLQLVRTADPAAPLVTVDGDATLFETTFSPNQVAFRVLGGARPSSVVLNVNAAPGWRSTLGPVDRDPDTGRPAVAMPPDEAGRYHFSYRPRGLWAGVAVLALALGGTAWGRRRTLPS